MGVVKVEGQFERGDPVAIMDKQGKMLGMGLSAYKSSSAVKLVGVRGEDIIFALGFAGRAELIHRNDLVLQD